MWAIATRGIYAESIRFLSLLLILFACAADPAVDFHRENLQFSALILSVSTNEKKTNKLDDLVLVLVQMSKRNAETRAKQNGGHRAS